MKTGAKLTRFAGFAIVIVTVTVAAMGFFVVRDDIEQMRDAGKENILWDALQVEIELMRFQRVLAEFSAGNPEITPRSVNDRYDILWSRLSVFEQGSVGRRLQAYDAENRAIAALFATVRAVEPQVVGLQPGDRAATVALQKRFDPFAERLRSLSRDVLHGEEAKFARLRDELSFSSELLLVMSVAAVLASLVMIFMFAREARQFRDLAAARAKLLAIAEETSRAKSQFLAMMSHELRTPMNGVLGLLALVRQQSLTGHQQRLLEKAEHSGRQMIGLLGDILDFSSLQDGRLKLEIRPFSPADLAAAVEETFEPVASREGIAFTARCDPACPARLLGDFARLRQALTHLATYLLETAGTRNIVLDLSHREGMLRAAISFDYASEGGEWRPELIMGSAASSESFASEALGPAVSRGLIDCMGGSTKLFTPAEDRIGVLVTVPAEELVVDELLILVACQSSALATICKASLRGENLRFVTAGDGTEPHVVMIEAGGSQEAERLAEYAAAYPRALLVALGRPQNRLAFDDVLEVPIDVATIRQAGFLRLAQGGAELAAERKLRYSGRGSTTKR